MVRDHFHTLSDIIVAGLRSPAGFDGVRYYYYSLA